MVYYRLKQYDFDGSAFVSDVILFRTGDLKSEGIDVFPNPNSGNLIYFKAIEGTEESAIVNLFNSTGVLVESQVIPFTSNSAYSVVTLEKQPSAGTYFLSISNSAVSSYQKIVFK